MFFKTFNRKYISEKCSARRLVYEQTVCGIHYFPGVVALPPEFLRCLSLYIGGKVLYKDGILQKEM